MSKFFFNALLWIMGIVSTDDASPLNDVKERGKCRNIVVSNNEVRIQFMNSEDAKVFAKDLKSLINQ